MTETVKITVFGGGSFGTALAYALSKNSNDIVILTRNPNDAAKINEEHHNPSYFSEFQLPPNISATAGKLTLFSLYMQIPLKH